MMDVYPWSPLMFYDVGEAQNKAKTSLKGWDLHPEKIPAHLKDKILAKKAAKAAARQNGGGNIIQAAIYNTPVNQKQ